MIALERVVGEALFAHLWHSTLLFLLVVALVFLLRRGSARVRFALWSLLVARLLIPAVPVIPSSIATAVDLPVASALIDAGRWWPGRAADLDEPAAIVVSKEVYDAPASAPPRIPTPWIALWACISTALVATFARQSFALSRSARRATDAPAAWRDDVDRLSRSLGLRTVPVRLSADLSTPALIGWLRPVILVPSYLAETLDGERRRAVLMHELIHVRRRDVPLHVAAVVARSLFFFHPVAWITCRQLCRERELAVDEAVLATRRITPMTYGSTLVQVAEATVKARRPLAHTVGAVTGARRDLEQRVVAVTRGTPRRGSSLPIWLTGAAMLLPTLRADLHASTEDAVPTLIRSQAARVSIDLPRGGASGAPIETDRTAFLVLIPRDGATEAVPVGDALAGGAFPLATHAAPAADLSIAPEGREAIWTVARKHDDVPRVATTRQLDEALQVLGDLAVDAESFPLNLHPSDDIPFREVVRTIDGARSRFGSRSPLSFQGTMITPETREAIEAALSPIPNWVGGDVVLVVDQETPWVRVARVMSVLGSKAVPRLTIAVEDAATARQIPIYLPLDGGVEIEEELVEEIEEVEILEQEELEVEAVEEVEEVEVEEIEIDEIEEDG